MVCGDLASQALNRHEEPLAMLAQQLGLVCARTGLPNFAVEVSNGGELDKVSIARCVLRKNNQMITPRGLVRLEVLQRLGIESVVDDLHIVANDRLDVCIGASSN